MITDDAVTFNVPFRIFAFECALVITVLRTLIPYIMSLDIFNISNNTKLCQSFSEMVLMTGFTRYVGISDKIAHLQIAALLVRISKN